MSELKPHPKRAGPGYLGDREDAWQIRMDSRPKRQSAYQLEFNRRSRDEPRFFQSL